MASERRLKWSALLALAGMLALASVAGMLNDSPRLMVLCALAGLPLLAWFWSCLGKLARPPVYSVVPASVVQMSDALVLEARLEHAPIALFRITGAQDAEALNAMARRLVAPGRTSDPAELFRQLGMQPVGQRSMISFDTERGVERALVSVSALSVQGAAQRLVALMPVESELEAEALNAWRQLVHVLTHEIMNSLTPVASLSRTAYELLDELRGALPPGVCADLVTALDAISRRADSLVDFVGSYRSLSNLPPARPELVRLEAMFERVAALVGPAWRAGGGRVDFSVDPASLELMVDAGQLEQALINLLKNAAEAGEGAAQAAAQVSARLGRGGRLRIEVSDNGPGVADALVAHIFTPFFSTRKHGSGVGLAMVRQLIHGNGGTVRYAKSVSAGARFVITF
ncbi:MAG: ATP-binding protein [Pseudomonadota bacterium]